MDEYLTEKEQLAAARKWWDENGRFVISGLVLGAAIIFGWNYYGNQKVTKSTNASMLHESLMRAVESNNLDAAQAARDELHATYASSPYTEQAALALAKLYAEAGDLEKSAAALRDALSARPQIAMVARLRLARLLVTQGKAQEALDLLNASPGTSFGPLFDEVRGDAQAALGNREAAAQAYRAALDSPASVLDRSFVQMKLDALGLEIAEK